MQILNKYKEWKEENPDEGFQYDEISEFLDAQSRGDLQGLLEYALEKFEKGNPKRKVLMFKVGDIAQVAGNISRHFFNIGDSIRIIEVDIDCQLEYTAEHLDGSDYWHLSEKDLVEI